MHLLNPEAHMAYWPTVQHVLPGLPRLPRKLRDWGLGSRFRGLGSRGLGLRV